MRTLQFRRFTWSEYVKRAREGWNGRYGYGKANPGAAQADWFGNASFDQAEKMATGDGWKAAVPEAESLAERVEEKVMANTMQSTFAAVHDVSGGEVDVAAFLSGEPECMIESTPIRVARMGRAVRIFVPTSQRAEISAETVRRRGAAVVALCDILSRAQHPLEIWAAHTAASTSRKHRFSYHVLVQEADQPLDMGRVMFALAHPAMQRRLGFAAMSTENDEFRKAYSITQRGGMFGLSINPDASELPDQQANTIVLPRIEHNGEWSFDYSVKWIQKTLETLFGDE